MLLNIGLRVKKYKSHKIAEHFV